MSFARKLEATPVSELERSKVANIDPVCQAEGGYITRLIELATILCKSQLYGAILTLLALFISGHLYRPVTIPEVGSTLTELKRRMGEPHLEESNPWTEGRVPHVQWHCTSTDIWVDFEDLPKVGEKRVLYYAGLLGTHRILVYIQDGRVVEVYQSAT